MKILTENQSRQLIKKLVRKTGSYAKLAKLVDPDITRQAVHNWYVLGIPPGRINKLLQIERDLYFVESVK